MQGASARSVVKIYKLVVSAFVITDRCATVMIFVHLSDCLSVWDWRAFNADLVYGCIVQCFGHPDTKHAHLLPAVFSSST